jgi:hypothetical protein
MPLRWLGPCIYRNILPYYKKMVRTGSDLMLDLFLKEV